MNPPAMEFVMFGKPMGGKAAFAAEEAEMRAAIPATLRALIDAAPSLDAAIDNCADAMIAGRVPCVRVEF